MTLIIAARNIGDATAFLQGSIRYTRSDGRTGVMALGKVRLGPGEVKAWEAKEAGLLRRAAIISAGLEFDYNTEPGSVVVSALSVSRSGNQVFQIPLLDPKSQTSSTGVYPFYLDYGYSTVVYIKNTTAVEQKYIAHFNYEGGEYMIGVKDIAAGETAAIDIRALRDNQLADEEGRTIPLDVMRGQARWAIILEEGTDLLAMIGRSELVNEVGGISSTYACQNCCGDHAEGDFITPSLTQLQVGGSAILRAFERRIDCYGFPYDVQRSASWSSDNQSVATVVKVSSGGQVTSVGAGQTTIRANWNSSATIPQQCSGPLGAIPNLPEPIPCCLMDIHFGSAIATVRVVPRVTISGAQTIMDGSTATFSIESPDATPSSITWSHTVASGGGNNPDVTFSAPNGMTTSTNGHWFALPNRECPATNCASTYNILCTVDFSLGFAVRLSVGTSLTVNACWNPAGVTPSATITGGPIIGFDSSRNLWVVTGSGSLTRNAPAAQVLVSSLSQFYQKTVTHENVHVQQWQSGTFSDLLTVQGLMQVLSPLTDVTQTGLIQRIGSASNTWFAQQEQLYVSRLSNAERQAHSTSDPLTPRYLYQNCGRY